MKNTKLRLILDFPFFGSLALRIPLVEDDSIKTAQTDGTQIRYNPIFTDSLSKGQKLFIYLHEIMHILLGHHERRGTRNPHLWNMACDYAVNLLIPTDCGVDAPEKIVLSEQFRDWSAEQIYGELAHEWEDVARQYTEDCDSEDPPNRQYEGAERYFKEVMKGVERHGMVVDAPSDAPQTADEIRSAATLIAQMTGGRDVPENIKELVYSFTDTAVPWTELLAQFMYESCQSRYTWMRPNSRYAATTGVFLPTRYSNDGVNLAVAVDTSGSIKRSLLDQFLSEFKSLISSIEYNTLKFVSCSDQITTEHTFVAGEDFTVNDLRLAGGNATRFQPVFKNLLESGRQPTCLVYFTDLFCDDFSLDPGFPVLWIGDYSEEWQKTHAARVPFGEVVSMKMAVN